MISVLCPTRGRPASVDRLVDSVRATAEGRVEFVFVVDDDDPLTGQARVLHEASPADLRVRVGPRATLSSLWNVAYAIARGPIVMQGGDDLVFRTPGWDRLVLEAFEREGAIQLVFGDDGGPNGRHFATHGFLHWHWTETLGQVTPPYFSSDFGDTWLNDLADRLGCKRFVPILTEHWHPVHGKGTWDRTHQERLARHAADQPQVRYAQLEPERQAQAERLRQVRDGERPPPPLWSILIATLRCRAAMFETVVTQQLLPQLTRAGVPASGVEILVAEDDGEEGIGVKRQRLLDAARGWYVQFIDDDDQLAPDYVARIWAALHEYPDYVGFRVQVDEEGHLHKPTDHSLRYARWFEDAQGYYRHISHLNPIRTGLARLGRFDGALGEDRRWADQVAGSGLVRREVYLPHVLYRYCYSRARSAFTTPVVPTGRERSVVRHPWIRYVDPAS